jgi:hypothetical protein
VADQRGDHLHAGLIVPWIAMWSAELVGPKMIETVDGWAPEPGARHVRKEHGMWMIAGPTRREGEPDFGSTHSWRQRQAMTQGLCQVCGQRHPGQMRWVIPAGGDHPTLWKDRLALNAPVCVGCLAYARTHCPHLRQHGPLAVVPVEGATPVMVTGDLWVGPGQVRPGVMVPLRSPPTRRMVGRELVVYVP